MLRSCLSPRAGPRRGLDGIDDGLITGAAAVIAGEMFAYTVAVRLGLKLQQILRRHQHSRRTKSALQRIAVAKRGLQVSNLAVIGQSFDRFNGRILRLYR